MKKYSKKQQLSIWGILFAGIFFFFNSCKRELYTQTTTDDVNITGYLEKYPEQFSMMSQVLDRSGTAGYLGAYGTYTLFAPNNDGVKAWLTAKGKSAVVDVSVDELKDFVKYHLIKDTLTTGRFTDGKIKMLTLYGQYLYTGVDVATSNYIINKQALVLKSNIITGNGIIHVLNKVLTPPVKTLAKEFESNSRYTIFAEALKATGFYDSLNHDLGTITDTTRKFQTVIAESDSVLRSKSINSFAELKAKLKSTNPTNSKDSLWLYVAYHISPGANYLSDIKGLSALYTLAPKEIVTTKLQSTTILINDDEFNGIKEPGVPLNKNRSDLMASNGVIHDANGSFKIKVRQQVPIYWDVAEQPELIAALGASYRPIGSTGSPLIVNGKSISSSISFQSTTIGTAGDSKYQPDHTLLIPSTRCFYGEDNLAFSTGNNRQAWVEITSPFLVKGKYKIWICYAQNNNGPVMQVTLDYGAAQQQVLPTLVDFRQGLGASGVAAADANKADADNLMLAQGFKRYMGHIYEYATFEGVSYRGLKAQSGGSGWDTNVGRLAGVADIETTDRHKIRFSVVGGGASSPNMYLDMIHFIPVDDTEGQYPLVGNLDQLYPRFHPKIGVRYTRP